MFADKETEVWGHQVGGGDVKGSPTGLGLMMLFSCHLTAEGTISRCPTCPGLPPSQQPQTTRSDSPVSQTPGIPSALVAQAAGREALRPSAVTEEGD